MEAINTDQLTRHFLGEINDRLGRKMNGDCIFVNCPLQPPLDDEFRVAIENIRKNSKEKHLTVMLETRGGFMETVERMVSVMRKHYGSVSFVVPNYAYSAGTILVLSGDRIYMDYYSVLGPIDPQYLSEDGKGYVPGSGYLAKFKELAEAINASTAQSDNAHRAELNYLVNKFDPAKLFEIEQSIKHGQSLIAKWLPKYKFKNWTKTQKRGRRVTPNMRKERAEEIAKTLGAAEKWHSHGRGISMRDLESDEVGLQIDDFGEDDTLSEIIRNYHGLCVDYLSNKLGYQGYIHTRHDMRRIM